MRVLVFDILNGSILYEKSIAMEAWLENESEESHPHKIIDKDVDIRGKRVNLSTYELEDLETRAFDKLTIAAGGSDAAVIQVTAGDYVSVDGRTTPVEADGNFEFAAEDPGVYRVQIYSTFANEVDVEIAAT